MRSIHTLGALCALLAVAVAPASAGILAGADLAMLKKAPGSAAPDTDIAYVLTLINAGPDAAAGAQFTDNLPAGLTFVSIAQDSGPAFACSDPGAGNNGTVSCQIATLAAGESAQFTLVAHIEADVPAGTVVTNFATAGSNAADPNEENNTAVAATTLPVPQSDVLVQKFADENAGPDQDLVYTINVANAGPDAAPNFTWQDTLPGDLTFVSLQQLSGTTMSCSTPALGAGGTVNCTLASFPAAETAQFALTVHVPAATPAGTVYTNTASAASDNPDPNEINSSAVANTTISAIDLAVDKAGPATAVAGDTLNYTLTLVNNGPDFATSAELVDTLPAPLTFVSLVQDSGPAFVCVTPGVGADGTVSCSNSAFPPGATATFTLVAQLPADTPNGTGVVNTADAVTDQFDADGSNDSDSVTTVVSNTADVSVSKSAPATASAGGTLAYTVVVANDGPDVASGVALADALPAGTTFVALAQSGAAFSCTTPAVGAGGSVDCSAASLASGAAATFTLTVQVDAAAADGATIGNTATVSSASADPNAANDSASVQTSVINQADLALTKTGPASADAGSNLVYTLVLSNDGPAPAAGVSLNDALPADTRFVSLAQSGTALACSTPAVGGTGTVTCTAASYANAASTTLTLTLLLSDAVPNPSAITNTATVAATTADPNPADNTATVTTNAANNADLGVTKTAPASVVAGANLAYTLVAGNAGPLADGATLFDTLPAGTGFVSLAQDSGPAFTCTTPAVGAAGSVSCVNAAFASGATATFTLTVQVAASNANGTSLSNTASIDGTRADPNPANDSATAVTTVSNQPNLVLGKTAPPEIEPGGLIAYGLDLANTGNAPAFDVVLEDPLPQQVRFVSLVQDSGPAFACTTPAVGLSGTVSCSSASFAAGASAHFTLTVAVPTGVGGSITNTASVATSSADAAPADNVSAAGTVVGVGTVTGTVTIPALSWLGLLALAAAIGLLGAAMTLRAR